jgi:hypothetical protein
LSVGALSILQRFLMSILIQMARAIAVRSGALLATEMPTNDAD